MCIKTRLAVLELSLLVVFLTAVAQNPQPDSRSATANSSKATPPDQRVDINRATLEELMKVPGITRAWADRIVRFRPYRTKADLEDQGIIPEDLYSRIKDAIIAHHIKQ